MTETIEIRPAFSDALETRDWDRIEALWLEALDEQPIPTAELFEVRRLIWKAGRKNLSRTLLELLAESLESTNNHGEALAALSELTRLADSKPKAEVLDRLVASFSAARAGSPSLAAVLERHPMVSTRRPLDDLQAAESWLDHDLGTVVEVVGQGVGRVVDLNLQLENIKVDIGGSRPVSVPFGAVKRYLRPLPEGDFRRRKVEDPEGLADFVKKQPAEALTQVLESLSGPSDVAAIKGALEGLLPTASWTSWWAKARKHPRILSSGSGSRLRYDVSHSAESADEILLQELREAPAADKLAIAKRLADRGSEIAESAGAVLEESLAALESAQPGVAWQTATILSGLPNGADAARKTRQRLLTEAEPLALLSGITDRIARADALDALSSAHADAWPQIWADWFLHEENPQLLSTMAGRLEGEGHRELLDQALEAIFRNHLQHVAQFIWACEVMGGEGCPETVKSRMTPSLLEKLPDAYTRKEFSSLRGRAKALLDGGQVAIQLLMESASAQQASRFSQRIDRIDAVEPQRARLVEQAAQHQHREPTSQVEPVLAATRETIEKKREELRTLLEVDIPKTLKGINAAAAEGDLRENFEYHMLRDRQELQSARAAKLQEELAVVRILEPGAADTSTVNIGTIVHLAPEAGEPVLPITILGAWDADLDRRIFANGSELAQRLMGRTVGDQVEVEDRTATITAIEAWVG
jgi:transcription elongation factor GreA